MSKIKPLQKGENIYRLFADKVASTRCSDPVHFRRTIIGYEVALFALEQGIARKQTRTETFLNALQTLRQ